MNDATPQTPTTQVREVTFGDKSVELSRFDRYKGRKGETDRLAFVGDKLIAAHFHFHNNRGYRCSSTKTKKAICCDHLGEPEQRFGIAVFKYSSTEDGKIADTGKLSGKVMVWNLTESRYSELTGINSSWPLMDAGFDQKQHDLIAKCTEEKFQRMTFTPAPEAHWKTKKTWYDTIKTRSNTASADLRKHFGRVVTDEQWNEIIGLAPKGTPTGGTANAGDVDLSELGVE